LERCGRQVRVGRVVVGEMWATGSRWEGCSWRDVGDRFELKGFSLEICGGQVRVGRVVVGEMWAISSSWEGFRWRDLGDRFIS
jgi:hypothetical protein